MRLALLLPAALLSVAFGTTPADAQRGRQTLCGWYENSSPGNHTIRDRAREWVIGAQGGFQAAGIERIPEAPQSRWVRPGGPGSYGYGCYCMQASTNARAGRITRIHSARAVPLAQCRADRRLREPRY